MHKHSQASLQAIFFFTDSTIYRIRRYQYGDLDRLISTELNDDNDPDHDQPFPVSKKHRTVEIISVHGFVDISPHRLLEHTISGSRVTIALNLGFAVMIVRKIKQPLLMSMGIPVTEYGINTHHKNLQQFPLPPGSAIISKLFTKRVLRITTFLSDGSYQGELKLQ